MTAAWVVHLVVPVSMDCLASKETSEAAAGTASLEQRAKREIADTKAELGRLEIEGPRVRKALLVKEETMVCQGCPDCLEHR